MRHGFSHEAHTGSKRTSKLSIGFVLLRESSCNFVDRVLEIRSHTIHEMTLRYRREHEIGVLVPRESQKIRIGGCVLLNRRAAELVGLEYAQWRCVDVNRD
jgi:hypothetical protein